MISNRQFQHRTWCNFRTQPQPKTLYSTGNEQDKSGATRKSSFHFLSEWNRKTFEQTSKVKIVLGLWLPKTISHFRRGWTRRLLPAHPPHSQLILVRLGCLLQKSKKSKHSLKSLSLPANQKSRFTYFVNASLAKINFTILQYFWKMYPRLWKWKLIYWVGN